MLNTNTFLAFILQDSSVMKVNNYKNSKNIFPCKKFLLSIIRVQFNQIEFTIRTILQLNQRKKMGKDVNNQSKP